jgi:hypothetical protein
VVRRSRFGALPRPAQRAAAGPACKARTTCRLAPVPDGTGLLLVTTSGGTGICLMRIAVKRAARNGEPGYFDVKAFGDRPPPAPTTCPPAARSGSRAGCASRSSRPRAATTPRASTSSPTPSSSLPTAAAGTTPGPRTARSGTPRRRPPEPPPGARTRSRSNGRRARDRPGRGPRGCVRRCLP